MNKLGTLAAVLIFCCQPAAHACSSTPPANEAEAERWRSEWIDGLVAEFRDAEYAFVGEVAAEMPHGLAETLAGEAFGWWEWDHPARRVWFDVKRPIRGDLQDQVSVYEGLFGSTCNFSPALHTGELVLVSAARRDGGPHLFGMFYTGEVMDELMSKLSEAGLITDRD